MLQVLTPREKEAAQRRGYMCEHLLCFYSMVSDQTALYDGNFPVYLNPWQEADVILFGLDDRGAAGASCVHDLMAHPFTTLNVVSPTPVPELSRGHQRYVDWDFHIDVAHFDLELKGSGYKNLRNRMHQVAAHGYLARQSRVFTPQHTYLLARHMARHPLEVWDYEELLSLERFFREHDHGLMIEAYHDDQLVGFDVVDFVDDGKVMVVPVGIYLDRPLVSDFLMYENLRWARARGCDWVDVGLACGSDGLRSFKEKWFAQPKYTLYVYTVPLSTPPG